MKKRKLLVMILAVATICAGMTGCGGSNDTSSGGSSESDASSDSGSDEGGSDESGSGGKTTLTITYRTNQSSTSDFAAEMLNQTYENWDKKDQVELKLNKNEASDSDYLTKVQLMMQDASQCGDLFFEDSFQLSSDVAAGYIADISEYLEGWDAWNNGEYVEAMKGATQCGDGYYGVLCSTDGRGLVVNKHVLEDAGLGTDWQPKDWDELLDGCRTIKEKCDGVIPMWMTTGKANGEGASMNGYEMLLYGTADGNDSLFDTKEEKYVVSSDGILAANQFIATLCEEELTGSYSELLGTGSDGFACDYLRTDKLGIYLTGSWFPANFQKGGSYEWDEFAEVLDFIPMPKQDGSGTITMSGGWCWSVPELSENKELAVEFLTEMMKPENYVIFNSADGNLPTVDLSAYPEVAERPFIDVAQGMLAEGLFRPKNELYSTVSTYIAQMSEEAATGLDAQAAMDAYKANVIGAIGEENTISK